MSYIFHPHTDMAGNARPGDVGTVVDDETGVMMYPSITYDNAVTLLGRVERVTHGPVAMADRPCSQHMPGDPICRRRPTAPAYYRWSS